MTNYNEIIKSNLSCFLGITQHPELISALDKDLNMLEKDFSLLVRNFCSQTDPDRAYDFLFEIWVCKMLRNSAAGNISYEPRTISNKPPDFRCVINGVQFDIQVKRMHNILNEIVKKRFQRECRKRLQKHSKTWFINLKISDELEPYHINEFFRYIKQNLSSFKSKPVFKGKIEENDYMWQFKGKKLVGFSFTEKNRKTGGISIGVVYSGNPGEFGLQRLDLELYRKSINRILKKSKTTFSETVSDKQSNIVIIQPASELWGLTSSDVMADILYGDDQTLVYSDSKGNECLKNIRGRNGILKNYHNITGVIFVKSNVSFMSEKFTGSYFLNELHLKEICIHPKIFEEMSYYVLHEWVSNKGGID
ncbi:MAG: hypothetical protein KJ915_03000 [Candidatus Omnitrophica bacterium]|nr:hypothetical protein [Candidatus Omnitrophota bacterium]